MTKITSKLILMYIDTILYDFVQRKISGHVTDHEAKSFQLIKTQIYANAPENVWSNASLYIIF